MFALFFLCTNVAYADSTNLTTNIAVSKYVLVMFGIVFFTVILFVGLSLYNRFFVAKQIKDYKLNKYSLAEPTDKDDAIVTYITKNRLR